MSACSYQEKGDWIPEHWQSVCKCILWWELPIQSQSHAWESMCEWLLLWWKMVGFVIRVWTCVWMDDCDRCCRALWGVCAWKVLWPVNASHFTRLYCWSVLSRMARQSFLIWGSYQKDVCSRNKEREYNHQCFLALFRPFIIPHYAAQIPSFFSFCTGETERLDAFSIGFVGRTQAKLKTQSTP